VEWRSDRGEKNYVNSVAVLSDTTRGPPRLNRLRREEKALSIIELLSEGKGGNISKKEEDEMCLHSVDYSVAACWIPSYRKKKMDGVDGRICTHRCDLF